MNEDARNKLIIQDLKNKYIVKKAINDGKAILKRNLQAEINKINSINTLIRMTDIPTSELSRLEFSLEILLKSIRNARCHKEKLQST